MFASGIELLWITCGVSLDGSVAERNAFGCLDGRPKRSMAARLPQTAPPTRNDPVTDATVRTVANISSVFNNNRKAPFSKLACAGPDFNAPLRALNAHRCAELQTHRAPIMKKP
jgi:hypothetical protein